ncbi:MAG: hypothetical protein JXA33_18490, partial [Anaerolineae bacterium]|nr:hypothetical protein [Anaerolineae bacterium]
MNLSEEKLPAGDEASAQLRGGANGSPLSAGAADVRIWQQQLIHGVLLSLVIVGPLALAAGSYYAYTTQTGWLIPIYLLIYGAMLAITFWRRVSYQVQVITCLTLIYAITVSDFLQDGRGGSGRVFLLAMISLSTLFFGRRGELAVLLLSLLTLIGFGVVYSMKWLVLPPAQEVRSADASGWISNTVVFLMIGVLLMVSNRYLVPRLMVALERSRRLAQDLELQRAGLERVVAERTEALSHRARYLEATADVARSIASILDIDELLARVVRLISERFDFYHTGIFLIDSAGEWAVLQAASSEGGQRMLANGLSEGRGYRLRVGAQGIVGLVAARGEPRIAFDV